MRTARPPPCARARPSLKPERGPQTERPLRCPRFGLSGACSTLRLTPVLYPTCSRARCFQPNEKTKVRIRLQICELEMLAPVADRRAFGSGRLCPVAASQIVFAVPAFDSGFRCLGHG